MTYIIPHLLWLWRALRERAWRDLNFVVPFFIGAFDFYDCFISLSFPWLRLVEIYYFFVMPLWLFHFIIIPLWSLNFIVVPLWFPFPCSMISFLCCALVIFVPFALQYLGSNCDDNLWCQCNLGCIRAQM